MRRLLDAHNRGADAERATYHGREGMERYPEERAEAFGAGEEVAHA